MGGLTQHDVLVAVVSAVLGAVIASIPVWITVAQVRRTRLKSEINDAVNAKIGDLVGGAFTNLLQLQHDAESSFNALRSSLEADAAKVTATVQSELDGALASARKTMDDLQRVAERAMRSASEIDEVKASALEHGVDLDALFDDAEARQNLALLETFQTKRRDRRGDLTKLIEESARPESERDVDVLTPLYREYGTTDFAATLDAAALAVKSAEHSVEVIQEAIARRKDSIAHKRQMDESPDELEESGPDLEDKNRADD